MPVQGEAFVACTFWYISAGTSTVMVMLFSKSLESFKMEQLRILIDYNRDMIMKRCEKKINNFNKINFHFRTHNIKASP